MHKNPPALALAAITLCLSGASVSHGSSISGPFVNSDNGHTYLLLDTASWTDSEAEAVSLGGHLVTISSAAENEWVWSTFKDKLPDPGTLWIGFSDQAKEGTWCWANGENAAFVHFQDGQPDDAHNSGIPGEGQDYAHLWIYDGIPKAWDDYNNQAFSSHGYGVVEIGGIERTDGPTCYVVPEPRDYALLSSLGLLSLAVVRARKPGGSAGI
jgi:hypothetical protein